MTNLQPFSICRMPGDRLLKTPVLELSTPDVFVISCYVILPVELQYMSHICQMHLLADVLSTISLIGLPDWAVYWNPYAVLRERQLPRCNHCSMVEWYLLECLISSIN